MSGREVISLTTNNSFTGLNVKSICSSLYCKLTNGNAILLDKVNQIFMGIYRVLPRIDGSDPLGEPVYQALG